MYDDDSSLNRFTAITSEATQQAGEGILSEYSIISFISSVYLSSFKTSPICITSYIGCYKGKSSSTNL